MNRYNQLLLAVQNKTWSRAYYNRIREKVDAFPLRAIEVMPEYDDSDKPRHIGWYSMVHDVLCVVGHD